MDCKQKRMGIVGCFGQIENIKRQSLINVIFIDSVEFMDAHLFSDAVAMVRTATAVLMKVFNYLFFNHIQQSQCDIIPRPA